MDELLADLNQEQRAAVLHDAGPLLVLAGPGSGKTRVVTRRLAYRISQGADPTRQMAVTFTNRAAAEMKTRIRDLVGHGAGVPIGTFHWICNALLRRYIHYLGYPARFRVLSPAESRALSRQALDQLSFGGSLRPADLATAISAMKNGASASELAERHGIELGTLAGARRRYDAALRKAGAVDLDDLLALAVELLTENPAVRARCQFAHDEILVDEYQDVNPVQHELVRLLRPPTNSVVAVGDEDQAIYGWRQADLQSILRFPQDFPGARTVKLEESYRCTKRILRSAGSLVEHNRSRIGKRVRTRNQAGDSPVCFVAGDEIEEAEWIAAEIERLTSTGTVKLESCAVLYRINAQSRAIEDAFVRRGLAYHVYSGRRYYDLPEVRRVSAYLRLMLDPEDHDAAESLLGGVPGIGAARLAALRESAAREGTTLLEAIGNVDCVPRLPSAARRRLQELSARFAALRPLRQASLRKALDAAIDAVKAESETSPERDVIAENLDELRTVIQEFAGGRATARDFVDRLAVGSEARQKPDGAHLMTLHSAKGLEFDAVFIAGLEEGLLPHRRALGSQEAIEEERRLCYVGMTRARSHLSVSYAHARLLGGQAMIGHSSRFIDESGRENLTVLTSHRAPHRPRLHAVRAGERVRHPRWREGTVMAVEGTGRDTLVTIRFDGVGRQRLQLCHAPLVRLEEDTRVLAG